MYSYPRGRSQAEHSEGWATAGRKRESNIKATKRGMRYEKTLQQCPAPYPRELGLGFAHPPKNTRTSSENQPQHKLQDDGLLTACVDDAVHLHTLQCCGSESLVVLSFRLGPTVNVKIDSGNLPGDLYVTNLSSCNVLVYFKHPYVSQQHAKRPTSTIITTIPSKREDKRPD